MSPSSWDAIAADPGCPGQLDLFRPGATISPGEQYLVELDASSRCARSSRLTYVEAELPQWDFLISVSMSFLLHEAKSTYVSGDFTATILLAQSFIEHWLLPRAVRSAGPRARRWGLAAMVDHFRDVGAMDPFLLDRLDDLRRIRNPFSHPRGGEDAVEWRSYHERIQVDRLMQRDARNALGLVYAVVHNVP